MENGNMLTTNTIQLNRRSGTVTQVYENGQFLHLQNDV